MKIQHVALWCTEIEVTREFYISYFNATSNAKYVNPSTGFQSYFLIFDNDVRIEVENEEAVDALTEQLRSDGYRIISNPRTTGEGYYGSVVIDPDGNRIEITA